MSTRWMEPGKHARVIGLLTVLISSSTSVHDMGRKTFQYLRKLGMKLRHPLHWGNVSLLDSSVSNSPLVFGYALHLSCISLRQNASRSPTETFLTTHHVIVSGLSQSLPLCDRIVPAGLATYLVSSTCDQLNLASLGGLCVASYPYV